VLSAPRGDIPAYPVFEIDGGVYGRLHSVLAPRNGRRPGNEPIKKWIDVGANLGVLSIALALANPAAVGWAYEPNPATFAYLRANIAANGLEGRLHAVNAGVTRHGRPIFMP
jgi:methylase of polypeptide subunit release factors